MQNRITAREFAEWMAFARVEPIGPGRGDLQAALIARTLAEIYRDPKKRSEAFKIADFMPQYWEQEEKQNPGWESMLAMVEMLNVAFGGLDLRENSGDISEPGS